MCWLNGVRGLFPGESVICFPLLVEATEAGGASESMDPLLVEATETPAEEEWKQRRRDSLLLVEAMLDGSTETRTGR